MGPYQHLFRIRVDHGYFADLKCRQLVWEASPASQAIMDNLGMLFRAEENGAAVYYDTSRADAMSLFALQARTNGTSLFFKIYSRDPHFLNYTDLAGYTNDTVIYLDSEDAVHESGDDYRLHNPPHVSKQQGVLLSKVLEKVELTRGDRGSPPLCVIRIRLVGGKGYPMDGKGRIRPMCWRVSFDSRHTYWKYNICGRLSTEPVSIQDSDDQWTFHASPAQALAGAGKMLSLMSSAPIPLKHQPSYTFQLKLQSKKRTRILIPKLPVAPVNMVHREILEGQKVYTSEIFIHS